MLEQREVGTNILRSKLQMDKEQASICTTTGGLGKSTAATITAGVNGPKQIDALGRSVCDSSSQSSVRWILSIDPVEVQYPSQRRNTLS